MGDNIGESARRHGDDGDGGGLYYYARGRRHPINREIGLVAVSVNGRAPLEALESLETGRHAGLVPSERFPEAQQEGGLRIYKVVRPTPSALEGAPAAPSEATLLDELRSDPAVRQAGEVFTNENGRVMVLTDEIVVKFKPDLDAAAIDALKQQHGLETVERITFVENGYLLRRNKTATRDTLAIANDLVEGGAAVYATPNFIEHVGYRSTADTVVAPPPARTTVADVRHGVHPTDPSFGLQWHHENTGQVVGGQAGTAGADIRTPQAWQITMGDASVVVAVIDGGTDIAHNDLSAPGKNLSPIDLMAATPDSNPLGGAHGTQVAGMAVAAANNGVAGTGSAPDCRLMAIKAGDTFPQLLMAQAYVYAADNGASVITCSLGPNATPWTMTDVLEEAIIYATTYGRGGRGCVCFQAVDNRDTKADGSPNPISGDEVSSFERTIAVSRTDNRDRWDGAARGVELDLCAPGSGVFTITNTTTTNKSATTTVTGTSFATPLTAGVGALVLSVNPQLSWTEARQVLLDTADKIDTAANPYAPAPAGRPPGTRNNRYGYGRVNARTAVERAQTPSPRDLQIRDTTADSGTVPQPPAGFWDSPDVWVRNADDGGTAHQNTVRGQDNFLHARVRNAGTEASLPCWVRFYLATFAGTEFRYPTDYKRDTRANKGGGTEGLLRDRADFPAAGTYLLGEQRFESIPAGANTVAKVRWPAALVPPAAGWHPCILVEVSPHDGPAATGVHVWENNNLAQKNLTIVDARRGQWLEFPFRVGHRFSNDRLVNLTVVRPRQAARWPVHLGIADATVLVDVIKLAKLRPLRPILPPLGGGLRPGPLVLPTRDGEARQPLRLTFLEETRVVLGDGAAGRADGEGALVLTFPQGSTLEVGSAQPAAPEPEAGDVGDVGDVGDLETLGEAQRAAFNVSSVHGMKTLALNASLAAASVAIPLRKPGGVESALRIQVPRTATPGQTLTFDVVQQDNRGITVGGVRLRVRVVG